MSLSTRGISRHYNNRIGQLSIKDDVMGGQGGSVRQRLEAVARENITFNVRECIFGWDAAFEQTWSHVVVRVLLEPDLGIADNVIADLRSDWEDGIEATWSNRWAIARTDELACELTFDVQWVDTNEHHTVRVRQGPMQTNLANWDTEDSGAVAAHEFGHMLGNPDEYLDSDCPDRDPVDTGTIMDNNSSIMPSRLQVRFAERVGSNIAPIA